MRVFKFALLKSLRMLALMLAVAVVSFVLVQFAPIDPVQAYVGGNAAVSAEQRERIAEYWGLNDPPAERFVKWGSALLRGDLGESKIYKRPVADVIGERFAASIALMAVAWVFSGVFGFLLGMVSAAHRGRFLDRAVKWLCLTLSSTPVFWFGLLMLMVFSVWLGWTPIGLSVPIGEAGAASFGARLAHMVLPALTLSITSLGPIALHTRAKLLDVMDSDFMLYARARGERGFGLYLRHGARNIVLPAITLQFASFGELFGGSVLAEQVFSYPGLGQAATQAGLRGDLPLLMGVVLCMALFVFLGNLTANILYGVIDPRIRKGAEA
ncbi:ABC transporter permease [Gehongia tenuis]|uniref:ABC transporter permease n=1 Tax=Gehongia tenuis TaxID=2763655 RepID=A0A926D2W1_9FIRM|nr:ABC transporter permease [Gehongia tenuis]MBC8530512.1 ABC transporter permease [Gehongia tenuis]